ncbi:MAG TPA: glutamate--tRNA ligase [Firmicutes bacterium]|nr:glutamate--tRNA ligase [Bacillota bacterium]
MEQVRVRFAPSPTGYLHVGGARTALFNWLFARHHGGVFVLRIEDTDTERSTKESMECILESMRWLGLDWDEGPEVGGDYGPYLQSERGEYYQEAVEKLLRMGRAYKCYCTPEELDEMREKALAEGRAPKYDGRCRDLTPEECAKLEAMGRKPVIRFKTNMDGETVINDLIRGPVTFANEVLDDFVLVKSDGGPTYNFAVVVDDVAMGITHVIRGEDHLSNTPRQIQLYEALGYALPQFAHIPMILGPDRKRLSKRHGATSVMEYEGAGYLPEAFVNYLALLGWAYDDHTELFTREELIAKFTLDKVSKNPAVFDNKKLLWMNGVYLRDLPLEDLVKRGVPWMQRAGYLPEELDDKLRDKVSKVFAAVQTRVRTLEELVNASYYFFTDAPQYDQSMVQKFLVKEYVPDMLKQLLERLLPLEPFTEETIEKVFVSLQQELDIGLGKLIQPVRVAVTGTNVSPGMYEVLALLGKAKTCERIRHAYQMSKELLGQSS